MIVWGGTTDDGAAYDPATDSRRLLPPGPLSARDRHAALWTGEEMIIAGGFPGRGAAAYRPGG